jgi:hypothetical protein
MNLDLLAKRLYPRLQTGRRIYQVKVLMAAISCGLAMGGVLIAIMFLMARTRG